MEVCPQCGNKLETPTVRLVQDSCGHRKCRVCLLEDETICKQCNNKDAQIENKTIISCYTPVITFKKQQDENTQKTTSNKTNSKTEETIKRAYQSLVIPDYITVNTKSPIYKCQLCQKTFNTKSHIKYHRYCNGDKKPFTCSICMKEFITKNHLEAHMIMHTGSKRHMCNICKKTFADKSKLIRHQILHSDDKPYICQECSKKFKSKESLKLHIRIHKGDKPFKCNKCSATFNNSSNLKKHDATHSKEKLHMCDQCGKRFKLKWALTVHHRIHLHLKPYECTNCGKAFKNSKDLHRHKLIHSDVKAYSCGVCTVEFRRRDNLIRHMKNTHPGMKVPPVKNPQVKHNVPKLTVQRRIVDTPNAINVIKALPDKAKEPKVPVINAPLKLAFKTSAFKSNYNIHRNYEPPIDDSDIGSINIYQKILQPNSPNSNTSQQDLDKISDDMINQYKNKPINYETSFMQTPHAIIKNIKFKLPDNYTNIKSTKEFMGLKPLTPVPIDNDAEKEIESNGIEYTELKPAKTSVIVNTSSDLHWRRRTLQSLNIQNKHIQEAVQ